MRHSRLRMTVVLASVAGLWMAVPSVFGQDDLRTLLTRLSGEQFDDRALHALEGHPPDARILPALEVAFDRRELKREKQAIAVTLLRLGDKSDKYFDFLAGYARDAVEDRTPYYVASDANGHAIQGRFDSAFENWCAANGKDPKSVAATQLSVYPDEAFFSGKEPGSSCSRGAQEGVGFTQHYCSRILRPGAWPATGRCGHSRHCESS